MKKKLFLFLFLLVGILFSPTLVSASEPTKKFYMDMTLQENGDIKVRELVSLSGEYNGWLREIDYQGNMIPFQGRTSDLEGSALYNGDGIENIKVSSVSNDSFSFEAMDKISSFFEQVSSAYNGDSGVYTLSYHGSEVSIKVYNPSHLDQAFYLEYTITNVAVVHNDIAELAWNILGDGYNENIGDFQAKIHLPKIASDLRVWLHGPLNGEIQPIEQEGAFVTYNFLGAYNPVSVRLMFPKEVISSSIKYSKMDAKEDILKIEQQLADEANQKREAMKRQNMVVTILSILWYILAIFLVLYACYVAKKSKKTDFTMEYYRDFPAEYGPEVLEYLLKKNISEESLSACILNLIYKKVLKVEEIVDDKKKKDYKLLLLIDDLSSLTTSEQDAIHLLIKEVGNGKEVLLSKVKKYGNSLSDARFFMDRYQDFLRDAKSLGKKENFFQGAPFSSFLSILVSLLGVVVSILAISFEISFDPAYVAGIAGIIFIIVVGTKRYYTPKGALQYAQWMAHKKFLEDFGRMDEKELPEVVLWDKYLVYATVLGCADTLQKQMKIKIDQMKVNQDKVVMGYDPILTHYYLHAAVYSSIHSSIHTAVASSRSSIIASQQSSGSGFGGGASGGGGSFGGGGGGGRF